MKNKQNKIEWRKEAKEFLHEIAKKTLETRGEEFRRKLLDGS